jgi:hypothetical protein
MNLFLETFFEKFFNLNLISHEKCSKWIESFCHTNKFNNGMEGVWRSLKEKVTQSPPLFTFQPTALTFLFERWEDRTIRARTSFIHQLHLQQIFSIKLQTQLIESWQDLLKKIDQRWKIHFFGFKISMSFAHENVLLSNIIFRFLSSSSFSIMNAQFCTNLTLSS